MTIPPYVSDFTVLLVALASMPLLAAVTLAAFLYDRREPDDSAWRGVHRAGAIRYVASHLPGRGRRHVPVRTRLEEETMQINPEVLLRETTEAWLATQAHEHQPWRDGSRLRCRTCMLDLDRPDGQPEIGRHGFSSW